LQSFWADPHDIGEAKERALKVASHFDCPIDNTKHVVDCLREIPVDKLARSLDTLFVK
jgi:hypothetical protein